MRKKIISFLYNNKFLKYFLPIFHKLIGRNILKKGKNNKFEVFNSHIYRNKFDFSSGTNNNIVIGKNTDLHHSNIIIKGNNNSVILGEDSFLNEINLIIEGDENFVILGKNVFICGYTRIYVVDGSSVIIEDNCMLSDNIEIRATDNHSIIDKISGNRINFEEPIVLHKNVWIGTGATLLKGSEIPEWCIVGEKTVVSKKFYVPNTIIVGNPAKEVKSNIEWRMERIKKNYNPEINI